MSRQYRHEIKYTISKTQAYILKQRLLKIMEVDPYGKKGYFIRSLYFDTPTNQAYNEKMDGVLYRRKYRIRLYNNDKDFIRLEKKIKDNDMTAKEQAKISMDVLSKILSNKLEIEDCDDKLLKEFLIDIKTKGLEPSVIVDYDRYALVYPVSDVRVTFDYNIKSGRYDYDLFKKDDGYKILDDDMVILEVKFNEILPYPIACILSTIPSTRNAFSKFAFCRSIK